MITNPDDVDKINDALNTLSDASEKVCDVRLSEHTPPSDIFALIDAVNFIAATKQKLSTLIPPAVP